MNMECSILFQDAIMNLQSGHLMPWDRQVLSDMPLPSTVIEPFTAQEVPDVQMSMRMTFEAMSVWINESKQTSYFSKRFVQLSRMIMNGVATMGRGLVTLHQRGEDLSSAPMSIQDLIGAASYQFRKSYLGVLQTVKSHPEISERLLFNQIGWNNMLMRLFKTRDKLAQPVIRAKTSVSGDQSLPAAEQDDQKKNLPGTKVRGISEPFSFTEPGAFSASRAFSSFDRSCKGSGSVSSEKHSENTKISAVKAESTAKPLNSDTSKENPDSENKTKNSKISKTKEIQMADQKAMNAGAIETQKKENQNPTSGSAEANRETDLCKATEMIQKPEADEKIRNSQTIETDTSPVENTSRTLDPFDLTGNSVFRELENFYRSAQPWQQNGLSP